MARTLRWLARRVKRRASVGQKAWLEPNENTGLREARAGAARRSTRCRSARRALSVEPGQREPEAEADVVLPRLVAGARPAGARRVPETCRPNRHAAGTCSRPISQRLSALSRHHAGRRASAWTPLARAAR